MEGFLCNTNKYRYGKGYIILPIVINNLPKTVIIENHTLQLKSNFHISLVCIKNILEKYSVENLEQKIIDTFCEFVSINDVSFVRYKDQFRFAEFEEKKTVIVLCEILNLEKLFQFFRDKFGFEIAIPPTHITLYTLQPNIGIGLNSQIELEEKSKPIKVPFVLE